MIILFSPFEPSQKELIDNAYNFCLFFYVFLDTKTFTVTHLL